MAAPTITLEEFNLLPPEQQEAIRQKTAYIYAKRAINRKARELGQPIPHPAVEPRESFIRVTPHPKQQLFLDLDDTKEALFGGATGGGKTVALLADALKYVHVKDYSALLLRRNFPDLKQEGGLIEVAHEWLTSTSAKWNEQDKEWMFPSGAKLRFGYLDTENDKYRYQGGEYQYVGFDEVTQFCLPPETEVLTKTGWKFITDVEAGEFVLSLAPDKRIEYAQAVRHWEFPYKGNMLRVQHDRLSYLVTPNHRMVIDGQKNGRWRFCEARDMPNFAYHPRKGNWIGSEIEWIDLPKISGQGIGVNQNSAERIKADDYLEFLGWYLSEGSSFLANAAQGGTKPCISIRQTRIARDLDALIERLPFRVSSDGDGGYRIFSRQLFNHLHPLGTQYTKRVPEWVKMLSVRQLKIFFNAFARGDGHFISTGAIEFGLCNEGLVDDLQEIAIKLGRASTKSQHVARGKYIVHRLYVYAEQLDRVEVRQKHRSLEPYDGKVYCLTVEPNHTFLARYKGQLFWSGNTESQYLYLYSRLRKKQGLDVPLRMRAATNPGGIGGQWVYDRFIPENFSPLDASKLKVWIKEGLDNQGKPITRAFVPSLLDDNPSLERESYIESLMQLDEITREQYLKGDWLIQIRGDILYTYSEAHTVISWDQFAEVFGEKKIPAHWRIGVYQDFGTTPEHPCVTSWFATAGQNAPEINGVSMADKVFLYRGMMLTQCTAADVGKMIRGVMSEYGEIGRTDRWQMSHEASSERLEYLQQGLSFSNWPTGKTRGIEQLKNAFSLQDTDKQHPFKSQLMGCPRLFLIVDKDELVYPKTDAGLARHRAEIPAYHTHKLKTGEVMTRWEPYPLFNDAIDTMRAAACDYFPISETLTFHEELDKEVKKRTVYANELKDDTSIAAQISRSFATAKAIKALQKDGWDVDDHGIEVEPEWSPDISGGW